VFFIWKVVVLALVVFVSVKNAVPEPSGLAVTSIRTPWGGIAELTVTVKGKSGPTPGASNWPLMAGLVVILRFSSGVVLPPPPPLLQEDNPKREMLVTINNKGNSLFMR
jgi:hypothetical protein